MMKRILLALAAMFTASTVNAQEINPDPGFASSGSWMEMGQVANVAIAGGKVSFTGPNVMTSVSRADTTVKRGRWYRVGVTVSNYTSGSVQPFIGNTMMGGGTGSYVPTVDLDGDTAIADNFTYADGIDVKASHVDGDGGGVSTFRMRCSVSHSAPVDPIAFAGMAGRSHSHTFFGNTEVDESTTSNSLRTRGMTSCGNFDTPNSPINRSSYWIPSMFNMKTGQIVNYQVLLYYRLDNGMSSLCTDGNANGCLATPRHIRQIYGKNFATGGGGPLDPDFEGGITWSCERPDASEVVRSASMVTAINACAASGDKTLRLGFGFPNCWDGQYLDTPNHRDHMKIATGGVCNTASHPYMIPSIALIIYFRLDQDAFDGFWRLSSDSMVAGAEPGSTIHADYWEGWSPTARDAIKNNCLFRVLSCNEGDFGNETGVDTDPVSPEGATVLGSNTQTLKNGYTSMGKVGLGKPCRANGTCVSDVYAWRDGEIGLVTHDGAVLDADDFTIVQIDRENGPVTVAD